MRAFRYCINLVLLGLIACDSKTTKENFLQVSENTQIKKEVVTQFFPDDSTTINSINQYNINGDATEAIEFDHMGREISREVYTYYSPGHQKESFWMDAQNDTLHHITYNYNFDSSLVIMESYLRGEPSVKYLFYKDENQNTISMAGYDDGTRIDSVYNRYDNRNNRIEQLEFNSNLRYRFTYDDKNHLIIKEVLELFTKKEKYHFTYRYKFDSLGSWIEKLEQDRNGKIRSQTTRVLTYF